MTTSADLAGEMIEIGHRAGLDRVAICDASPFDDARSVIEARKADGSSAGMQFTFRNPARSTDPSRALEGARSLVVGARSYARRGPRRNPSSSEARRAATSTDAVDQPPQMPTGEGPPSAAVAMYSWTDHYGLLRDALGQVAHALRQAGWAAKVLSDDNALVDRAAAVRAGLGWYGKNCNVLLPDAGSLFVVGSVVTDAPLSTTNPPPVADGCGSCRRCMVGCPTGALVAPGHLDGRRCLAWLLQAPGPFPREFREALGDRLYGCDECQVVCPVNKLASRHHPPPPAEPQAQTHVAVLDLLAAGDREIEARVGRWYIPNREMRYVRRNALVVLGNIGDASDGRVVAALERALTDSDTMLRAHAVWAARRLGLNDLLRLVSGDTDPQVRAELD